MWQKRLSRAIPRASSTALRQMAKIALISACLGGCDGESAPETTSAAPVEPPPPPAPPPEPPPIEIMPEPVCPPDMVKVTPREPPTEPGDPRRSYCVDRYEAMLVDHDSGQRISPYYAPSRRQASAAARAWESMRFEMGEPRQQAIPLPSLPAWQLAKDFAPRAVVREGVTPNGHVSGEQAALACRNAGKRLCTPGEWLQACKGQRVEPFPYGPDYVAGQCNVFREGHPAAILHGKASIGHTDPRLNTVTVNGKPLLRKTGETKTCVSRWGDDGIFDMVGNLDEWVDDPEGTFAGGFYARSTKDGCMKRVSAHPFHYADYSTGVRCCADLPTAPR